jgi:hypothetical protein
MMNKTATIGLWSLPAAIFFGFIGHEITAASISAETFPLFSYNPYISVSQDQQLSSDVADIATGDPVEKVVGFHKLGDLYQEVAQAIFAIVPNPSNYR